MKPTRKSYPSDVSNEEWSFCAPYLTLMKEEAPQRDHPLREVFGRSTERRRRRYWIRNFSRIVDVQLQSKSQLSEIVRACCPAA